MLLALGKKKQNILELTKQVKANPEDPQGFVELGWAYFVSGYKEQAKTAYLQALTLQKDFIPAVRSCFSRNHAFNWFVIAIMGFIVRGDSLGITSIIRELNLNPKFYVTFLHFFRSSAWNLEPLTRQWIKLVIKSVELQKVNGMNILIGDGVKQSKEGQISEGSWTKNNELLEKCAECHSIRWHLTNKGHEQSDNIKGFECKLCH